MDYFNTVCNMSKKPKFCSLLFCLSYFSFLVTLGSDVTEIQRYYVIFVYIFQGKMGKTGKKRNENHTTKVTKIPKAKRRKNMGWTKHLQGLELSHKSKSKLFLAIECSLKTIFLLQNCNEIISKHFFWLQNWYYSMIPYLLPKNDW